MARRPDGEIGEIRKQFERQCLSALAATPNISRGELVRRFGEGIGRGTGFRWIAELLGDGGQEKAETSLPPAQEPDGVAEHHPIHHATALPVDAPPAAAPAPPPADPPPQVALTGEVIQPDRLAGTDTTDAGSTISAVAELAECLRIARALVAHAHDPETGKVRNVRLLLAASEHRRRIIETAARVQATLLEHGKLDDWNAALFAAIERADPAAHRKILEAMRNHIDAFDIKTGGRVR